MQRRRCRLYMHNTTSSLRNTKLRAFIMYCDRGIEYVSRQNILMLELTTIGAQNSTQTMCGDPVRDNTKVTPITTGVFGGLAILGVAMRCVATKGSFALDDIFAVAALIVALPMGILEFFMSSDGFGKDLWTIPPANIYRIVQVSKPNHGPDSYLPRAVHVAYRDLLRHGPRSD